MMTVGKIFSYDVVFVIYWIPVCLSSLLDPKLGSSGARSRPSRRDMKSRRLGHGLCLDPSLGRRRRMMTQRVFGTLKEIGSQRSRLFYLH